jgi:type IX secretion system PorP/SprF family membrane protein
MKMKRLLLYIIVICGFCSISNAQQLALYSQYFQNNYIINPAVAGTEIDYSPLRLAVHKQWVGITEAPSTQVVSLHHKLDNNLMGVGGMIFHDRFGPIRTIGVQSTYAYHLKVNRELNVSLGLSAVFMQYILSLAQEDFYSYEPVLTRDRSSVTVPDANFGVYAYQKNNKYWGGLSIAHILQSKLKISGTWMDQSNRMVRHYFLMGGYKLGFPGTQLEVEPSTLLKMTETTPLQVDANIKVYWNRNIWASLSVREGDSFITSFGFIFEEYFFGFSYDFTFSDIANHTVGSQELIFGWNLDLRRRQGTAFY